MRKLLILIGIAVAGLSASACVPIAIPAPEPPAPPPPANIMVGDSVASLAGEHMADTENDAVGGTTACDTAANLPARTPKRLIVHVGGHSWGNYDEATWQACTLRIVDTFLARGSEVYVATAPMPGAIYCANPFYVALAESAGNPHTSGDLTFELKTRLENANAWKMGTLPTLRPRVHIVDWRGLEHAGTPDCIHFTPAGADAAAARTVAAFR